MDHTRAHIVGILRRAGLAELAATAEDTLPDPVDAKTVTRFCREHHLSLSSLMDRMGASPL